jgi:hypothetical protein
MYNSNSVSNGSSSSNSSITAGNVTGQWVSTTPGLPAAGSSSSSSGLTTVPGGTWQRRGFLDQYLSQDVLRTVADPQGGLTALPFWQQWGDAQLLAAWDAAVAELPAAVDALAAVSLQGPARLVCFDLETTNCELVVCCAGRL